MKNFFSEHRLIGLTPDQNKPNLVKPDPSETPKTSEGNSEMQGKDSQELVENVRKKEKEITARIEAFEKLSAGLHPDEIKDFEGRLKPKIIAISAAIEDMNKGREQNHIDLIGKIDAVLGDMAPIFKTLQEQEAESSFTIERSGGLVNITVARIGGRQIPSVSVARFDGRQEYPPAPLPEGRNFFRYAIGSSQGKGEKATIQFPTGKEVTVDLDTLGKIEKGNGDKSPQIDLGRIAKVQKTVVATPTKQPSQPAKPNTLADAIKATAPKAATPAKPNASTARNPAADPSTSVRATVRNITLPKATTAKPGAQAMKAPKTQNKLSTVASKPAATPSTSVKATVTKVQQAPEDDGEQFLSMRQATNQSVEMIAKAESRAQMTAPGLYTEQSGAAISRALKNYISHATEELMARKSNVKSDPREKPRIAELESGLAKYEERLTAVMLRSSEELYAGTLPGQRNMPPKRQEAPTKQPSQPPKPNTLADAIRATAPKAATPAKPKPKTVPPTFAPTLETKRGNSDTVSDQFDALKKETIDAEKLIAKAEGLARMTKEGSNNTPSAIKAMESARMDYRAAAMQELKSLNSAGSKQKEEPRILQLEADLMKNELSLLDLRSQAKTAEFAKAPKPAPSRATPSEFEAATGSIGNARSITTPQSKKSTNYLASNSSGANTPSTARFTPEPISRGTGLDTPAKTIVLKPKVKAEKKENPEEDVRQKARQLAQRIAGLLSGGADSNKENVQTLRKELSKTIEDFRSKGPEERERGRIIGQEIAEEFQIIDGPSTKPSLSLTFSENGFALDEIGAAENKEATKIAKPKKIKIPKEARLTAGKAKKESKKVTAQPVTETAEVSQEPTVKAPPLAPNPPAAEVATVAPPIATPNVTPANTPTPTKAAEAPRSSSEPARVSPEKREFMEYNFKQAGQKEIFKRDMTKLDKASDKKWSIISTYGKTNGNVPFLYKKVEVTVRDPRTQKETKEMRLFAYAPDSNGYQMMDSNTGEWTILGPDADNLTEAYKAGMKFKPGEYAKIMAAVQQDPKYASELQVQTRNYKMESKLKYSASKNFGPDSFKPEDDEWQGQNREIALALQNAKDGVKPVSQPQVASRPTATPLPATQPRSAPNTVAAPSGTPNQANVTPVNNTGNAPTIRPASLQTPVNAPNNTAAAPNAAPAAGPAKSTNTKGGTSPETSDDPRGEPKTKGEAIDRQMTGALKRLNDAKTDQEKWGAIKDLFVAIAEFMRSITKGDYKEAYAKDAPKVAGAGTPEKENEKQKQKSVYDRIGDELRARKDGKPLEEQMALLEQEKTAELKKLTEIESPKNAEDIKKLKDQGTKLQSDRTKLLSEQSTIKDTDTDAAAKKTAVDTQLKSLDDLIKKNTEALQAAEKQAGTLTETRKRLSEDLAIIKEGKQQVTAILEGLKKKLEPLQKLGGFKSYVLKMSPENMLVLSLKEVSDEFGKEMIKIGGVKVGNDIEIDPTKVEAEKIDPAAKPETPEKETAAKVKEEGEKILQNKGLKIVDVGVNGKEYELDATGFTEYYFHFNEKSAQWEWHYENDPVQHSTDKLPVDKWGDDSDLKPDSEVPIPEIYRTGFDYYTQDLNNTGLAQAKGIIHELHGVKKQPDPATVQKEISMRKQKGEAFFKTAKNIAIVDKGVNGKEYELKGSDGYTEYYFRLNETSGKWEWRYENDPVQHSTDKHPVDKWADDKTLLPDSEVPIPETYRTALGFGPIGLNSTSVLPTFENLNDLNDTDLVIANGIITELNRINKGTV